MSNPHMRVMAALLAMVLGMGASRPAWGAADLAAESGADRPTYLLGNEFVQSEVNPLGGGAVSIAWGSPARRAVLAADSCRGAPCDYEVLEYVRADELSMLSLRWTDGAGLEITKTIYVLAGRQTVSVDYEIANGSQSSAVLEPAFSFAPDGSGWDLCLRHGRGTVRGSMPDVAARIGTTFDHVRWFELLDADRRGVTVIAGAGALRRLSFGAAGAAEVLHATGASTLVPGGRVLRTRLVLAPTEGIGPLACARETILCSASMERVGPTCRISLGLLPLADLGTGPAHLEIVDEDTGDVRTLGAGEVTLRCGRRESLALQWEDQPPGVSRLDLVVPGIREPVTLGQCRVSKEWHRFGAQPTPPARPVTLGTTRGEPRRSPTAGVREAAQPFYGAAGRPLDALRIDLGVGETETVLFGVRSAAARDAVGIALEELDEKRGPGKLPPSTWQFLNVEADAGDSTTECAGRLTPAQPGPAVAGPLVGLRLRVGEARPGVYLGRIDVAATDRSRSLPVEVTVRPVRRPRPGLVRLHLNAFPADPLADPGLERVPVEALRRCEVANATLDAAALARAARVLRQGRPDRSIPLSEWLGGAEAADGRAPLPGLTFEGLDAGLLRLLLAGFAEATVCGRLSPAHVAPAGSPAARRTELAEWYWRALARHLRSRGFGRLCFVGREPYGPADLGPDWFEAAGVLHRSGWSVCGPYEPSVLTADVLPRLLTLTRTLLIHHTGREGSGGTDVALPEGVELGSWSPGLPYDLSMADAAEFLRRMAAPGGSIVVLDQAVWPRALFSGAMPPESGDAAWLESLAWEGLRDGLDEENYWRMLSWYGGPGARVMPAAGRSSRRAAAPLKSVALEKIAGIAAAAGRRSASLYWHDLLLVHRGEPKAVVAVYPDSTVQQRQADLLNEIVSGKCGIRLPVRDIQKVLDGSEARLVILLGSPASNPLVRELAGPGAERMAARMAGSGFSLEPFVRDGTRFLALLSPEPHQWGMPIQCFAAGLRREGNWLIR